MNVKGVVFCARCPSRAWSSPDGEVVTTTDDAGCYYLASKKTPRLRLHERTFGHEPQSENSVP